MNKKIWEKPEVKVLDVKRDTKMAVTCNHSGGGHGGHGGHVEHGGEGHGGGPGGGGHWPW